MRIVAAEITVRGSGVHLERGGFGAARAIGLGGTMQARGTRRAAGGGAVRFLGLAGAHPALTRASATDLHSTRTIDLATLVHALRAAPPQVRAELQVRTWPVPGPGRAGELTRLLLGPLLAPTQRSLSIRLTTRWRPAEQAALGPLLERADGHVLDAAEAAVRRWAARVGVTVTVAGSTADTPPQAAVRRAFAVAPSPHRSPTETLASLDRADLLPGLIATELRVALRPDLPGTTVTVVGEAFGQSAAPLPSGLVAPHRVQPISAPVLAAPFGTGPILGSDAHGAAVSLSPAHLGLDVVSTAPDAGYRLLRLLATRTVGAGIPVVVITDDPESWWATASLIGDPEWFSIRRDVGAPGHGVTIVEAGMSPSGPGVIRVDAPATARADAVLRVHESALELETMSGSLALQSVSIPEELDVLTAGPRIPALR